MNPDSVVSHEIHHPTRYNKQAKKSRSLGIIYGPVIIIPGGLLTTFVYGGVRMKGQIQTQKYGSIKTVFPKFCA